MNKKTEILLELEAISRLVAQQSTQLPYHVPMGYFESFPDQMLIKIRNLEKESTFEHDPEVPGLSFDHMAGKKMPFELPVDYFDQFAVNMLKVIHEEKSWEEELKMHAPFLSGLPKSNPFNLPENYFDTFIPLQKVNKSAPVARVISLNNWRKMAAAAVFTGLILLSAVVYFSGGFSEKQNITVATPEIINTESISEEAMAVFLEGNTYELPSQNISAEEFPIALLNIDENTISELLQNVEEKAINDYMTENPDLEYNAKVN